MKPKYTYEPGGHVTHKVLGRDVTVPIKRATRIDYSRYDGETLRQIRAKKGVGRPLGK